MPAEKPPIPRRPLDPARRFHALWAALLLHVPGPDTRTLLDEVGALLPCGQCRAHLATWRARLLAAGTRDAFFAVVVELKNEVNARRGVPTLSLDEARARWGM